MSKQVHHIREWREDHFRQTLQDFAARLGVSISSLANWEHGRKTPRVTMQQRIAERLGLDFSQITYGEPPQKERAA